MLCLNRPKDNNHVFQRVDLDNPSIKPTQGFISKFVPGQYLEISDHLLDVQDQQLTGNFQNDLHGEASFTFNDAGLG